MVFYKVAADSSIISSTSQIL